MQKSEMERMISEGSAASKDFVCITTRQDDGSYKVEYSDMRDYREYVKDFVREYREAKERLWEAHLYRPIHST